MDLICLVYDYTDSEIIWLIMKEALDSWSFLLPLKCCKMIVQFQNTVKYHESTLSTMTLPSPNLVSQSPNRNFQTQWFYPWKAHINMVGWTPSLEPPKFPKDDKNVSPRRTPTASSVWPLTFTNHRQVMIWVRLCISPCAWTIILTSCQKLHLYNGRKFSKTPRSMVM